MAVHRIQNLNYMTVGKDRIFLNIDTFCLDSTLSDTVAVIRADVPVQDDVAISAGLQPTVVIRADSSENAESEIRKKLDFNRSLSVFGRTVEIERNMVGNEINSLSSQTGGVVGGVYEIEDVCMKSHQDQLGYDILKFDPPNLPRQDIYVPQISSQPIQFCSTGSSVKTYMIMEETENAADILWMEQDRSTQAYTMELSTIKHETVAYKPKDPGSTYASMVSSDPETASQEIFDRFRKISGVKYATIASFPMVNVKSRYFDGNVYCIPYAGKNQYGATYSMEMDGPDSLSVQRRYEGIMSSGNKIYLKYRDIASDSGDTLPYQKIEQFIPVNNNDHGRSFHKSQLFSVGIRNTEIENIEDSDVADRIRTDITNAVFRMAEKVCPAQTQLIDVRFGDRT